MIYPVSKKQCSNSGQKQNDIDLLGSYFIVQSPSPLEFPAPLTPPFPTPLEFPIPSVVGVWIFSGTTQYIKLNFKYIYNKAKILSRNMI